MNELEREDKWKLPSLRDFGFFAPCAPCIARTRWHWAKNLMWCKWYDMHHYYDSVSDGDCKSIMMIENWVMAMGNLRQEKKMIDMNIFLATSSLEEKITLMYGLLQWKNVQALFSWFNAQSITSMSSSRCYALPPPRTKPSNIASTCELPRPLPVPSKESPRGGTGRMDVTLSLDMIRNLVVLFQYIATAELNIIMMAMSHCAPHPKQRPNQVWRSSTHFFQCIFSTLSTISPKMLKLWIHLKISFVFCTKTSSSKFLQISELELSVVPFPGI